MERGKKLSEYGGDEDMRIQSWKQEVIHRRREEMNEVMEGEVGKDVR